jgi:HK97 family phage prohead protease
MPKTHEHVVKSNPVFITNTDEAQGIVEAIVNVFGVLDTQDDIIHPGAYTKTLNERGNQVKVRVLDNHNNHSILDVIGKALDTHEVGRDGLPAEVLTQYPEATGGLYTKTQFLMDTPEGLGAFKRLASGAVDEWSIALDVMQQDYSREKTTDGKTVAARNIRQLLLFEYSPVIWGANPATAVVGLKNDDPVVKPVEAEAMNPVAQPNPIPEKEKQNNPGTVLSHFVSGMAACVNDCAEDLLEDGMIDLPQFMNIGAALNAALTAFMGALPDDVAAMPAPENDYDDWYWFNRSTGAAQKQRQARVQKEGRSISGANRAVLSAHVDTVMSSVKSVQDLLDATDSTNPEMSGPTDAAMSGAHSPDKTSAQAGPEETQRVEAPPTVSIAEIERQLSELQALV